MERSELINSAIELDDKIQEYIRRRSLQAWMQVSLTIPQYKTLLYVSSKGGTSPGKLANALNVTAANVTGIVDRLVDGGLLSRQETPEDRRTLTLRTTKKGETMLTDLRGRRSSTMRNTLTPMPESELECLVEGLSYLAKSATAIQSESKEDADAADPAEGREATASDRAALKSL